MAGDVPRGGPGLPSPHGLSEAEDHGRLVAAQARLSKNMFGDPGGREAHADYVAPSDCLQTYPPLGGRSGCSCGTEKNRNDFLTRRIVRCTMLRKQFSAT